MNKKRILERKKDYYCRNANKIKDKNTKYYANNKESVLEQKKDYNKRNNNSIAKKKRQYYAENRDKIVAQNLRYIRKRSHVDPLYRASRNLRSRLYSAIKGNYKSGSAIKDLGCSIEEFKVHIEAQFKQGMTWDNYGMKGWHIDHIKPLSKFDLSNSEQVKKACHYSNLQPMWWHENLSKGDKSEIQRNRN